MTFPAMPSGSAPPAGNFACVECDVDIDLHMITAPGAEPFAICTACLRRAFEQAFKVSTPN